MTDALNILGTAASILGAFYAWHQATNAKAYAEKAKKQVAGHRRSSDLSHLRAKWETTYEVLAVFGASARPADLRGRNTTDAARQVQNYLAEVMSRRSSLLAIADLDERNAILTKLLSDFSSARSSDDMKSLGTELLNKLGNLDAAICTVLNREMETVNLT
jgi:hypothetical protein